MFMLVWMPQDIGFLYLFCLGASSGLVVGQDKPPTERKRRRHRSSRGSSSRESSSRRSSSSQPAAPADEPQHIPAKEWQE
jgi:hypothetical protein